MYVCLCEQHAELLLMPAVGETNQEAKQNATQSLYHLLS